MILTLLPSYAVKAEALDSLLLGPSLPTNNKNNGSTSFHILRTIIGSTPG